MGDHLVFWGSQQLRTGPSGFLLVSTGVHNSEAGLSIHLCVAALAGKQNLGEELGFGTVIEAEDRRAGCEEKWGAEVISAQNRPISITAQFYQSQLYLKAKEEDNL